MLYVKAIELVVHFSYEATALATFVESFICRCIYLFSLSQQRCFKDAEGKSVIAKTLYEFVKIKTLTIFETEVRGINLEMINIIETKNLSAYFA